MSETITADLTIRDRQILRHALHLYMTLGLYDYEEMKQLVIKLGIPINEKKEGVAPHHEQTQRSPAPCPQQDMASRTTY